MELLLPSSPVWYQTKSCDTSIDGYFAFASRSLVYLLDIKEEIPTYYGVLSGHGERVTTCSFSCTKPKDGRLYLVSGSDDGTAKVWNVAAKSLVNESKVNGIGKLAAVHWSPVSDHMIAYGDEKGCLVVWNLEKNMNNKFFPDGGHQPISCVVFSPYYEQLVAVGFKSGTISVVDIRNKGTVFRKFRGHGNEIQSVVWSHFPKENIFHVIKEETEAESLEQNTEQHSERSREAVIASGSKDRTIRLWSLSKGKVLKILKLPNKPSKGRKTGDDAARIYVTLHWPQDSVSCFMSSSYSGDVIRWDLSKPDKDMHEIFTANSPAAGHQRIVFNITAGINPQNTIITTSMDRQIKFWSLNNPQSPPTCSLPTLGGFVYSIAISPVDPSIVAFGVGDGSIGVWKTRNPHNIFDVTVLWQGVKEKVMSLAWHPVIEGSLAFATEKGKFGLYDVLSGKPPTISDTYHIDAVYSMSWGPHCYNDSNQPTETSLWLYTCGGEGKILMHPPTLDRDGVDTWQIISSSNPHHHAVKIDAAPASELRRQKWEMRSDVAWRGDYQVVAMGNSNGSYDLYKAPHLHHLVTVKVHTSIINCLRWCPVAPEHEFHNLLASGSKNTSVCITNVKNAIDHVKPLCQPPDDNDHDPPMFTEAYRTLSGHSARITDLSWNVNDPNQLVSASYDGTLQVWNVKTGEGVSNYRGHDGKTLCVGWNPIIDRGKGSGLIYSGGDDYSVHVWKMEKQHNRMPPKEPQNMVNIQKQSSQWKRNKKKKKAQNGGNTVDGGQNRSGESFPARKLDDNHSEIEMLLELKKKELLHDMGLINGDSSHEHVACENSPLHSTLNPHAEPFKTDAISSGAVKDVLFNLSQNRKLTMETKDSDYHGKVRKRMKNLFPLSVSLDNRRKEYQQQDCIDITKLSIDELLKLIPDRPNLGLYGDRKSTYRMLYKEEEKLIENGSYDGSYSLKIWRTDIVGAIESAIERNDLTDQLVAMAPMAGHDVWLRACSCFADQLSNEGFHLHAVNYYLACNKINEAVTTLRDNKLYREAIALARARFHDDHELVTGSIKVWGQRLKYGGSFEMAAKCFASIRDYRQAADCLAERARAKSSLNKEDLRAVMTAAVVAKSSQLPNTHEYLKHALLDVATSSGRWKDCQDAARRFDPALLEVRLILCVHESLWLYICASCENYSLEELFTEPLRSEWSQDRIFKDFNFVESILTIWNGNTPLDCLDFEAIRRMIDSLSMTSSTADLTLKQWMYRVSLLLTSAMLCFITTPPIASLFRSCKQCMTSCQEVPCADDAVQNLMSTIYENILRCMADVADDVNAKTYMNDVMCEKISVVENVDHVNSRSET